ncbi:rod shape-determining protein MreD [Candidatus Erwinia haradaeae]|nr:rod shape-determining protein MreD [Candidatus Erwinia haradaeae]
MNSFRSCRYGVIWLSFLAALILQGIQWPELLSSFRPSWILLILIYWILITPDQINISTAFAVGIVTDLVYGSTLGVHSLALSVITYLVSRQNYKIFNLPIWQQVLYVIIFSWIMDMMVFGLELLIINITFCPEQLWNGVINGMVWPWMFLLMQKINYHLCSSKKVVF